MKQKLHTKIDGGDCFKKNALLLIEQYGNVPEAKVVHGICTGTGGEVRGIKFAHCWVEYGDVVHDVANGRNYLGRKEPYYEAGKITYTVSYTRKELFQMMVKHNSYGGFDDKINAAIDSAIKAVQKRRDNVRY